MPFNQKASTEMFRPAWRNAQAAALLVPFVLVTLFASFVAACNAPTTDATGAANATGPFPSATRTSVGGEVTVAVTWLGISAGPVFAVAMDTHSLDLDGYDLKDLAVLKTGAGLELRPIAWDAPKGGHHRDGTLTFPATGPDGGPSIAPDALTVTLVIRGVADVRERTFQWTL